MEYKREWRDENGDLKSTDELKSISQKWNAQTWERYLSEYCYAEVEVLQSTDFIDRTALEDFASLIGDSKSYEKFPSLKNLIASANKKLSVRERKIVQMLYYENYSIEEITKELSQKETTIKTYRSRALGKIKKILLESLEAGDEVRAWFKNHKYPKI